MTESSNQSPGDVQNGAQNDARSEADNGANKQADNGANKQADNGADKQADNQAREPATLYDIIGGETTLRAMVDRFYDLMELEPEFAGIRAMHPPSTDGSRDKLFWFLTGWMGGPDLYQEQFGHPRLRARHLPFAVGTGERDQWLRAMAWAMEDVGIDADLRLRLMQSFYQTADWMRNKAE